MSDSREMKETQKKKKGEKTYLTILSKASWMSKARFREKRGSSKNRICLHRPMIREVRCFAAGQVRKKKEKRLMSPGYSGPDPAF